MRFAFYIMLICAAVCAQEPIDIEFSLEGENLISQQQPNSPSQKLTMGLNKDATIPPAVDGGGLDIPFPPPSFTELSRGKVLFVTTVGEGSEDELLKDRRPFDNLLIWRLRFEFGNIAISGAANDEITLIWEGEGGVNLFNTVPYSRVELIDDTTIIDMKTLSRHTFSRESIASRDVSIKLENDAIVHPVDTNSDQSISLFELLAYAGPCAEAFQKGVNGAYCFDGATLLPDTAGCVGDQETHACDTDSDARITLFELLAFAGPVAEAFQLGSNGAYCFDGDTIAPKTGEECGF